MATPAFTRQQLDAAGDLDFATPPRSARPAQDLTITVHARLDGFDCELCFSGDIERLHAVVARLRVLGAEPAAAAAPGIPAPPIATNGSSKPKAERVEPIYKPDGTPCCPEHRTPLRDGKWGKFCPTKDKETGEYCKLKFTED